LQVAYDKAYDEGRFNDIQEANYIRAIEREPVAALWKMIADPPGNSYFLAKFTRVEERLDGLKRPLVGDGSDKLIYRESDDDLSGLRVAVRRLPRGEGDGGIETAAIIPFRWVKGTGVVPLDPPDNLRVLMRLKKSGEHAMVGMSFSLTSAADGTMELRPEIYTSPKFGADRFGAAASTVVSPRGCMDCHGLGYVTAGGNYRSPRTVGDAQFVTSVGKMPGVGGFLEDARKNGASEPEIQELKALIVRPDVNVMTWPRLQIAVLKLWNAIYYANQAYLDDADGRFVEYNETYGSAWLDAGDLDKALAHFDKAISRNPEIAIIYLKRGWVHLRKKHFQDALRDLDQSIRLDRKLAFAFAVRSAVYSKLGDYERAKQEAEQAVRLGPKMAATYFARAEAASLLKEFRTALEDTDQAIFFEPTHYGAHNLKAWILATARASELRNGALAVREATQACELSGWKTPEVLDTLAAAYAEAGNFADAIKWQEKALADENLPKNVGEAQVQAARDRLGLYRRNLPFHDAPSAQAVRTAR